MPVGPNGEPLPYASEGASPSDILRSMLQLAGEYRQAERDEQDLLAMEQATTLLQKLLAAQQQQQDDLIQGKASPQALRRFG